MGVQWADTDATVLESDSDLSELRKKLEEGK